MNLFQSLWEKLLDKYRNYASAQKERIQHLQELELENEQHKGHIQNPLSLVSRNREISRLKREIKDYRNKCLSVCGVNCTPFVRQYGILSNKWGVFLCQKEYQTNDIRRNSKNW